MAKEKIILCDISSKGYDHLMQTKFCNPAQLFYVNVKANKFFSNIAEAKDKKLNLLKDRKDFIRHDVSNIANDDVYNFLEALSMLDIQRRYPNISIREGIGDLKVDEHELIYTYHIFDNMLDLQGKLRSNPLVIPILGENIYIKAKYDRLYNS